MNTGSAWPEKTQAILGSGWKTPTKTILTGMTTGSRISTTIALTKKKTPGGSRTVAIKSNWKACAHDGALPVIVKNVMPAINRNASPIKGAFTTDQIRTSNVNLSFARTIASVRATNTVVGIPARTYGFLVTKNNEESEPIAMIIQIAGLTRRMIQRDRGASASSEPKDSSCTIKNVSMSVMHVNIVSKKEETSLLSGTRLIGTSFTAN